MSLNVKDVLQAPIIRFDTIDSTNNRAAALINAETSVEGLTIVTHQQSAGKGQRGNVWKDEIAQSVLMSIVIHPRVSIDEQFSFSAAVAVAVAEVLQSLDERLDVRIKFPNDIIINDKKAAGILIENSLKGNQWTHAIVGVGINLLQKNFEGLPNATSVWMETGKEIEIELVMQQIREKIVEHTRLSHLDYYLACYNDLLYKKSQSQIFLQQGEAFEAIIVAVNNKGMLVLQSSDGSRKEFANGALSWVW